MVDAGERGGRHRDELARPRRGSRGERRLRRARSSPTCRTSTSTSTARSRRTATPSSACSSGCRSTRRAAGPGVGVINARRRPRERLHRRGARRRSAARHLRHAARGATSGSCSSIEADGHGLAVSRVGSAAAAGRSTSPSPGRFNAHNALAVLGLAHGWDLDLDAVSAALAAFPGVPGPHGARRPAASRSWSSSTTPTRPASLDAAPRELQPLAAPTAAA